MKTLTDYKLLRAILALLLVLPGLGLLGQEEGDAGGGDAAEADGGDAGGGDAAGGDAGGGDAGGGDAGGGPGGDAGGAPASPAEAAVTSGGTSAPATAGTGSVESNDYVKLARQVGASNWDDVKAFSKDDVKAAAEMAARSGGGTNTLTQLKELKKEFAGSLGSLNKMTRKGDNFSLKELSSADTIESFKRKVEKAGSFDKVSTYLIQGDAKDLSEIKSTANDDVFIHMVTIVENGATAADATTVIETAVLAGETDLTAVATQSTEKRNALVEKVKLAKEAGEDVGAVFLEVQKKLRDAAEILSDAASAAFNIAKTSIGVAETADAVDGIVTAFNAGHTEDARSGLDLAAYGATQKDLLTALATGNQQAAASAAFTRAKLAINDATTTGEVDLVVSAFKAEFSASGLDLTSDATTRTTAINLAAAAVQALASSITAAKAEIDGAADKTSVNALVIKFKGENLGEHDASDEIYSYGVTRKEDILTAAVAAAKTAAQTAYNTAVSNIKSATTQAQVEQYVSDFESTHGDAGGDSYKTANLTAYGQTIIGFLTASEADKPLIALNLAKKEIGKAGSNDSVKTIVDDYKAEYGTQTELITPLESAATTQYSRIATTAESKAENDIAAATTNQQVGDIVTTYKAEYGDQSELITKLEGVATSQYEDIADPNVATAKTSIYDATDTTNIDAVVTTFKADYPNAGDELTQSVTDAATDRKSALSAFDSAKTSIAAALTSDEVDVLASSFAGDHSNDARTELDLTDGTTARKSAISAFGTAKTDIAAALTSNAVDALVTGFQTGPDKDNIAGLDLTSVATARTSAITSFETAKTNIAAALSPDAVQDYVTGFENGPDKDNIAGLDLTSAATVRTSAITSFETAKTNIAAALSPDAVDALVTAFKAGENIAGLDLTTVATSRKSSITAFGTAKTNIAAALTSDTVDALVTGFQTGDNIAGLDLTTDSDTRKQWIALWQLDDIVPSVLYANNANSGFGAALEQAVALAESILTDNTISNSLPFGSVYNGSQLTGSGYNYELLRIIAKYGGIGSKSTAAGVDIDSIITYLGGDVSANGQSAFSAVTNALISGSTSQLQKTDGEKTILDTNVLGTNKITIDPDSESLFTIKTSNVNASLGANVDIQSGANVNVSLYLGEAANSRERKVLVIGAAKDLTFKGDATFTNTNDVEDHALAIGAADDVYFRSEFSSANAADYNDPDPIKVKYTGSNMGIGSYDTMRLVNVNLETGGNLALSSLDELLITSTRPNDPTTFTVGTGGKNSDPDNVYLYAHNLIQTNGLQFGGRVDDVYMEAITINLNDVHFPSNSDVMLRSRDGTLHFNTFSSPKVGSVNLTDVSHGGTTLNEGMFSGSTGHINSAITLGNGTPAVKIRGFSKENSNTN